MPYLLILTISLMSCPLLAQTSALESKVYRWEDAKIDSSHHRVRRHFIQSNSRDLAYLEIHATTLAAQQPLHPPHTHDREELVIVKQGKVKISIEQQEKTLGPGSVALIMPGDRHELTNVGEDSATFFILLYESRSKSDSTRATAGGGSLMVDWEDIPFRESEKGGTRSFFERPTAMLQRLEMHVTTLKPGIQSHPPHTHRPAEIILMLQGESQEQIDEQHFTAQAGDFYFLGSETLHTIKNTGTQPCTYFAFQFH